MIRNVAHVGFAIAAVVAAFSAEGGELELKTASSGEYRWFETFMKTADGAELYTYGVVPTNGVKCPVILMRTPYDGHRLDRGAEKWAAGAAESIGFGYARVVQQCRGSSRSTGVRIPYVDERRDSLAALDFVRRLPCYDGEIFVEGGSYLSSVHWAYLDECPADVKGAVLNIQCADRYPVVMHNGFPKIGLHINWYAEQYKSNVPDFARHSEVSPAEIPFCDFTKRFFGDGHEGALPGLDDIILHPRPEDPFWQTTGGAGGEYRRAFVNSKIPILMTTGWFDIYADAMCDQWREASPERRANCALVIDAFDHGGRRRGEATNQTSVVRFPGGSRHDPERIVRSVEWFDYVRGLRPAPAQVEVGGVTWYSLWENAWHRAKEIPAGAASLALVPTATDDRSYRYDPRAPAKFPTGCGLGFGKISPMPEPDFRSDVLTYLFDPVAGTIDVAGRMQVSLTAKSDCEDTAVYVRVSVRKAGTDVFYGLRESIKSLTWDDGDYTPGTERTLRFELADIAFRLEKGDVLRLDVSSSNAAMFAPHTNVKGLQAFVREPKIAVNTVLAKGLSLTLPVLADDVAWSSPTGPAKDYYDSIWEPRVVAVPLRDSGPELLRVRPDGEIICCGRRLYGTNQVSLVMGSRDFGFNWTVRKPEAADYECEHGPIPGISRYGRFLSLKTRHRWIFSTYEKCQDRIGYYPVLVYSDDDGKTWSKRVEISDVLYCDKIEPPDRSLRWNTGCHEPDIVELSDGTLYMMTRSGGDHAVCYLSHDGGETWGPRFEPPAFWQSNTMPLLRRLRDGRILCLWNNTQILPRPDVADYPELPKTAISGRWESVFTNRDALHAAISEDDGKTWIGFREIALNDIRNCEDYRERGNEFWQMSGGGGIDKSVHQAEVVEMPDGKIMVCYGQAIASRRIAVFDVRWLYETSREETLRGGTVNLSNHLFVKSLLGSYAGWSGHCSLNRIAGAVMTREPDTAQGTKRECLKVCRIRDERLVDDHQGVVWNFPAAAKGEVSFECRVDGEGVLVSLCDHWINPCDWAIRERAMTSVPLTATELGGARRWKTVTISWDLAAATATLACEGREVSVPLKTDGFSPFGVSYLHLQTLAAAHDPDGVCFRWFKMTGAPRPACK